MLKFHTLTTKLAFGKYKGHTFEEVLGMDPAYLWWCVENVKGFGMNSEAKAALEECDMCDCDDLEYDSMRFQDLDDHWW